MLLLILLKNAPNKKILPAMAKSERETPTGNRNISDRCLVVKIFVHSEREVSFVPLLPLFMPWM